VTSPPRAARTIQLALGVVGITLLGVVVQKVGVARLVTDLHQFGAAIVGVVLFELLVDACNTLAWRRTLPANVPVPLARLFWVRQAGVALNQLTPTATVGGEVAKALLLKGHLPMATTAASLVAARMSYALGQAILVLLGLTAVLGRLHDAPDLAIALVVVFTLTVGGVLAFVWLQRGGIFATTIARIRQWGFAEGLLARLHAGGAALDAELSSLYRDRLGDFVSSVAWHLAGQLVGLVQLAFILTALDVPTPLGTCLAMEAFALVLDSAAFLVPGRIGVQEAGRVLVFTTFGLTAATGLAVAIIVRLTQLAVAALGLAAFAYFSFLNAPAPAPHAPSTDA
jgi:glycosyltransferase 2 family protein